MAAVSYNYRNGGVTAAEAEQEERIMAGFGIQAMNPLGANQASVNQSDMALLNNMISSPNMGFSAPAGASDGFSGSPDLAEEAGGANPMQQLISYLEAEIQSLQAEMSSGQGDQNTANQLANDQQMLNQLTGGNGGNGGGGSDTPSGILGAPDLGGGGGGGMAPTSGGGSGGGSGSGGNSPGVASSNAPPIQATGQAAQAAQIAQSQLGKASISVNIPQYSHAGGTGNDCADFASACVADAGTFKKQAGDANVGQFQNDLQSQGWRATSTPQPADVALANGSQHAEVVVGPNGQCIGSNGGETNQSVSRDTPSSWGSVVYYAPPGGKTG